MAIVNTCKRPKFTYGTANGNPCTFNAGLCGLPLEKLVVSFKATQSGEGTPSPSNPRSIVGLSSVDLSANSVPVSVPLGDTYYEGTLDLLTGLLTITPNHRLVDMSTLNFTYVTSDQVPYFRAPISPLATGYNGDNMCSCYGKSPVNNLNSLPDLSFVLRSTNFNIRDDSYTDATAFTNSLSGQYIYYELSTPQIPVIYQLTPEQLSAVKGQNTISGGAEITDIAAEFLKVSGG